MITIVFSIFIPSLEFKTDFKDFAPDNELVKANNRVTDYFGSDQQIMFLLIENRDGTSVITPESLREQYKIEQKLLENPEVNGTISIITFLETICQLEFNTAFKNCTDDQIEIALSDLLNEPQNTETKIFSVDDQDETNDFNKYPRLSKKYSINSADIKNCFIYKENNSISFSIEVYDLSALSQLKPPFPKVHSMEWFLEFEDILAPKEYKIVYQIAARIEPKNNFWVIGNGFLKNFQEFVKHIRNHDLFNTYKKEAYLWIKPPGQETSIPIELTDGNVTFDLKNNRINIIVPQDELSKYGIAVHYGDLVIPSKLSNFSAGVRYYETPLFKRPGSVVSINTSFLFKRINKLHNRLILGPVFSNLLQKYGGISWDDFISLSNNSSNWLPGNLSLDYINNFWIQSDHAPDSGVSTTVFSILPSLFDELRINALSLISSDYSQTKNPKSDLILLQLHSSNEFNQISEINTKIVNQVNELNKNLKSISAQATGEGVITSQINESTSSANQIIIPSIFIIIMIVLFINFRRPTYVFLPVLVFIVASTWLFGTMALLHIPFSVISIALIPLLIGLGVEYSVNIFVNYRNEIEKGKSSIEAIKTSLKEIGVAIFMAWLTTFVAFISFITALIPPVRDFGVLLAIGITYTFIVTMTLMISIRYIVDRRKTIKIKKSGKISVNNIMSNVSKTILHHRKKIIAVAFIVTLFMGFGLIELKTGFSTTQFIPQDNQALTLFNKISDEFPSSGQDQEYILIEGDVATVATLKGISQTLNNFKDDSFVVRNPDGTEKTDNIYGIIREAVLNNNSLISKFNIEQSTYIPKTDKDVEALFDYLYNNEQYSMQVKNVLYKKTSNYGATLIRVYLTSSFMSTTSDQTKEFEDIEKELNKDLANYGTAKAVITGNLFITFSIMTSLTQSQILSTGVSFILAILILIFIFRNPILGAIAMIPVVFSIIWVLGTMYYIGYTLNVLTITVTSITIGVGVDYAIYITQRFRLVADKTGDPEKAVTETVSRTGSAVFIAALSSMLGFGILVTAPIPPQVQFGLITSITLVYAFLNSIIVLPLVLARWAKWRKKKKGYIISPGPPKDSD